MKSVDFIDKVFKEEIKSGSIFEVLNNDEKIGEIGIVKTSISYLSFDNIPEDLYTGNYDFKKKVGK